MTSRTQAARPCVGASSPASRRSAAIAMSQSARGTKSGLEPIQTFLILTFLFFMFATPRK